MKSLLGAALGIGVLTAFALAWRTATTSNASIMDQQWLYLLALPYNFTALQVFGGSDFSADAPAQVVTAAGAEAAVAYFAGAVVEIIARGLWRTVKRLASPA